jgi:3-hydroxyisobutyrate dehydrogenase-like beta-hydroxyacid dehydrogenase
VRRYSGVPKRRAAKRLLVVAAGDGETIERCSPVFDAVGRQTFVGGKEPWQANAVKLCGNLMIASMLESFGEAYATLRKAEVDPHLFLDVMSALFGSPVYANYGKLIADEKFEPAGFALRLGFKDARLAIETARECASPMPNREPDTRSPAGSDRVGDGRDRLVGGGAGLGDPRGSGVWRARIEV